MEQTIYFQHLKNYWEQKYNIVLIIAVVSFLCVPETRGMDLHQLEAIYKKSPQVVT